MKIISKIKETNVSPAKKRKQASHPKFGKMKLLAMMPMLDETTREKNTKEYTLEPSLNQR